MTLHISNVYDVLNVLVNILQITSYFILFIFTLTLCGFTSLLMLPERCSCMATSFSFDILAIFSWLQIHNYEHLSPVLLLSGGTELCQSFDQTSSVS